MQRCSKCILPDTYPGISFNSEGVCNYCREYEPFHRHLGKETLRETLRSRPAEGQYDCVVPVSGGKDSTYILYYIVEELGLHPLAVSYDSGFQTEIARENVRTACARLAVPLVIVTPPGDSQPKLLREWILLSAKVGWLYGPCGGNCETILRTASITAARTHRTPWVIWGSSALESDEAKDYVNYKALGTRSKGRIPRSFRRSMARLQIIAHSPSKVRKIPSLAYPHVGYHALKFDVLSIVQRVRLAMPLRTAIKPRAVPPFTEEHPGFVHFFDYIEWDSIHTIQMLEKKLGWKHPEGRDSRFDCTVHCLTNYQQIQTHGISHDGVNFCNFVREGKMDRSEALQREEAIVRSVESERDELLAKVGLSADKIPPISRAMVS